MSLLAFSDSHGRLVEISNECGGAKSDWRTVSRETEGRHDSSAYLDRDRDRQDSRTDIGAPSIRAFHSNQCGNDLAMGQPYSHDSLLQRDRYRSFEITFNLTRSFSKNRPVKTIFLHRFLIGGNRLEKE